MNAMATQARIDIYGTLRRIFEDERLSKPAAHLLIGLISYAYGKTVAWPSNRTLAKAARVSERQLRRLLAELRTLGWISERHDVSPFIRPMTIQFSLWHDCQVSHDSISGDGRPASGPGARSDVTGRTSSVRGEDMECPEEDVRRPSEGIVCPGEDAECPTQVGATRQGTDIACPGEDIQCPGEGVGCPSEDAQCPKDIRRPSENMTHQVKIGNNEQGEDIQCPGGEDIQCPPELINKNKINKNHVKRTEETGKLDIASDELRREDLMEDEMNDESDITEEEFEERPIEGGWRDEAEEGGTSVRGDWLPRKRRSEGPSAIWALLGGRRSSHEPPASPIMDNRPMFLGEILRAQIPLDGSGDVCHNDSCQTSSGQFGPSPEARSGGHPVLSRMLADLERIIRQNDREAVDGTE